MSSDPLSKKLNYQLQQMAFQKYPFEINNKNFFCLESYFEDELLNGVDLQIKQAKGMTSEPQKIAYISQSQQIILPMGSNIISYNAQKRSYSLLTEVNGFVEILRTYTSKINNRTFIFWLQSDEEGLNMKISMENPNQGSVKLNNGNEAQKVEKQNEKVTSIWDLGPLANAFQGRKIPIDNINDDIRGGITQSTNKKVKFQEQDVTKSKKKVRIQAPEKQTPPPAQSKNKKKMRICIFDFEKKCMLHRQPLQIKLDEIISEIFLYFMPEKIVGYVINDEEQARGRVYYKKMKIDESYYMPKTSSKRMMSKIRAKANAKKVEKYNTLDSIFELPLLKYNGETDQYLFKDVNTVYSLQVYQVEHELAANRISGKKIQLDQEGNEIPSSQHSIKIEAQSEAEMDGEIGSMSKNSISCFSRKSTESKEKYNLKICEEVQLLTDEIIIDISISEVYLVVLTNQFIRFYSIFNLNTLLFRCQIHGLKEYPLPSSVELNRSYLLLTHENSTFVSSYSILQRKLKYNSTCQVQIQHCQSILKLFMNSYNCQVAILAKQFQIEGRMTNILKSKKTIQFSSPSYKKTYLDVSLAYINFSSTKCQTKALYMKNQRFRNILTCKWQSQYLIQTENQILAKDWRQGFENLKCACLHPTGQYIVIGFNDCFKLYAVTQEGLQNTYMSDGVKDCQAIAYSQYGQHFAVGSSNTINIYSSYNCRKQLTINLPMGSLVQSLQYRNNHLICILKTKRIVIYHALLEYKQVFTFNPKNYLNQNKHELQKRPVGESVHNLMALTIKGLVSIDVNSLFYDLDLNVVIFSSGKKMFFLNMLTNESLGTYDFDSISCMEYNKHLATLFLGTSNGQLVAFPWPNKPSNILAQLPRFRFHSEKITKIKLTTDFKYLITLGNDMSIYKSNVSYILNLKRLKGSEIAQYKGNKNVAAYCNFLYNRGICQFAHSQTTQKLQNKKELEQEVVNTVFMLPEERMKQKEQLFDQISTTKEELTSENLKEYEPLQEQSLALRNKIISLKDELANLQKVREITIEREKQRYQEETSKLFILFSELHQKLKTVKVQLEQKTEKIKLENQRKHEELLKQHKAKEKQLIREIEAKQRQNQKQENNFLELTLIDEQKESFLKNQLAIYQQEFEQLTTKNGQLSCKNSSIQKEILVSKYRIEELKFVIINANQSIQKLEKKKTKESQEKIVFSTLLVENAKIDVSEMEKKYIRATKELIEKNKVIDINLNRYEKEKDILVTLQKTVQSTESEIDRVVQSLQQEKGFMKELNHRKETYIARYKELTQLRNNAKFIKNKGEIQLKKFLQEIQDLEKQLQSSLNQNKKQFCTQDNTLRLKLKNLQNFGTKKHLFSAQKEEISLKDTAKTLTYRQNFKSKESELLSFRQSNQNPLSTLLSQMRKTESGFSRSRKEKKLTRCTTEQNRYVGDRQGSKTGKSKLNLKMNHNRFKQQFAKFRKDDLIKGNVTQICPQSERTKTVQSPPKLTKKPTKRYYQMRTQTNPKSQRRTVNTFQSPQAKLFTPIDQNNNFLATFYEHSKQIQKQKQIIQKNLKSQQKLVNKIKTDQFLFMTRKQRLHMQNQDLIKTYNSLTYDSKYLKNLVQAYEETLDQHDKHYIFNNPVHVKQFSKKFVAFANEDNSKTFSNAQNSSMNAGNLTYDGKIEEEHQSKTPFEKYLKSKEKKMKELIHKIDGDEFQETAGPSGFKPTLNKLKAKTSKAQRINTVPCVQITMHK